MQPMPPDGDRLVASCERRHGTSGVAVASLIGLLALLVSGYTAYIQREQVRAQVWPHLMRAYVDPDGTTETQFKLAFFNKGVGPAIVRGVWLTVDGKPRTTWKDVFAALGLPTSGYGYSTLSGNVLSPGETLSALVFADRDALARFRQAMNTRVKLDVCYCSTLDDCWIVADRDHPDQTGMQPIAECPRRAAADSFRD